MRKPYRGVWWLVIMAMLCLPAVVADQLDIQNAIDKRDEAEREKDDLDGKIAWAIHTENTLVQQLRDLDWDLQISEQNLQSLQYQLAQLDEQIADIQGKIRETEAYQAEMDELAKERIRALYKTSTANYLEVLFSATSYSDFVQGFDQVSVLLERDLTLLKKLQMTKDEQDTYQRQLESDLAEQKRNQEMEIVYVQGLHDQQQEKKWLIDDIGSQREAWEASRAEWERQSLEWGEQIRLFQEMNRGKAQGSGNYIWPLPGIYEITSRFGWRPDPFGGNSDNNHSGLDIAANTGTEILAVDGGIVIMAETGYNGGYGTMVMIDHGNDVATIYGHCSSLLVSAGQTVAQGEAVALVGNTGWSTGPHLHIEFRESGVRVDPEAYLPMPW